MAWEIFLYKTEAKTGTLGGRPCVRVRKEKLTTDSPRPAAQEEKPPSFTRPQRPLGPTALHPQNKGGLVGGSGSLRPSSILGQTVPHGHTALGFTVHYIYPHIQDSLYILRRNQIVFVFTLKLDHFHFFIFLNWSIFIFCLNIFSLFKQAAEKEMFSNFSPTENRSFSFYEPAFI